MCTIEHHGYRQGCYDCTYKTLAVNLTDNKKNAERIGNADHCCKQQNLLQDNMWQDKNAYTDIYSYTN